MPETTTVGSGEHQVVCLHGWFGTGQGWGLLPEIVDQQRFTYVFPDIRGYGRRRGESGEYTMAEVGRDTIALADEMGIDRFSLIGHSMGATAAAYAQLEAPDRIRALVGVAPVAPAPVPFDDDGNALFFGAADNPDNRRAIIDFTTGNRHSDAWLDSMVEHSTQTSDRDAFAGYAQSWITDDYTDRLDSPDVPVLVLPGSHDPALGEDTMRGTWMQWYPNAELHVMAEAGHYPMYETPVALATVIETFLAGH